MSGQTSDRPSSQVRYSQGWHESYLKEQQENYNQKVAEFKKTDDEVHHNTDPKTIARLEKTRDKLYQELKELYEELKEFCNKNSYEFLLELPRHYKASLPRCKRRTVVLGSLGITGLVILLRFFKLLQPLELAFYDHLIRFRLDPKPSDKVLVIQATDKDVADQLTEGQAVIGSLSNETLAKVLEKVDQLKPIAVGLDIYRDTAVLNRPQDRALKQRFAAEDSNLFTVCKSPFSDAEVAPPPDAHPGRVAFSDFVSDSDSVVRRYTLAYDARENEQDTSNTKCNTNFSLALSLASQYLRSQHGIELKNLENYNSDEQSAFANSDYCLKFTDPQGKDVIFPNFQRYMGGYQNVQNYTRCQVLINYQREKLTRYSSENKTEAEAVTVGDFLSDKEFPKEKYENRIVLIGSLAYNTVRDYWGTPYTDSSGGEDMPGVEIQAQMVTQIINTVVPGSGGRPMLWVLPQFNGIQWGEFLWIWAWSLAGGGLVWWWCKAKSSVIAIVAASAGGYIVCFLVFQLSGGWMPFIPVMGGLVLTGAMVHWLTWRSVSRDEIDILTQKPQS